MSSDDVAGAGPLGGAGGEHGGQVRAAVAAWLMAHAATGRPVAGFDLTGEEAIPEQVRVEVDQPVDDLEIRFCASNRAFVQSKGRLKLEETTSSPFGKAVAQWCAQAEVGFNDGDRVVIVTAHASDRIRALARALDRRRDPLAGHPSPVERDAMGVLLGHLEPLEESVRQRLLDHASILVLALDIEGSGDAGVAAEMFDSRVVGPGEGRRAFRALRDRFRDRAVLRSGVDLDRMLDLLRNEELHLVGDAEASVAARRLATREALGRLRVAQSKAASEIDLRQLGVAAPPITAVELAHRPGVLISTQSSIGHVPVMAMRRRSRVLLVGPTGAGKTVLLRQLTAAIGTDEVVAVFVRLRRILDVGLDGDPIEALVQAACDEVGADDRRLVADAIRRAASQGVMFLALDGLDETRERRFDVVTWVSRLVDRLHRDVEVVLATRSSAYAAASTLGFHELGIAAVERWEPIARPILEALSPEVPPLEHLGWVDERVRWVGDAFRGAKVSPTPLTVTVLALLAAEAAQGGLPTGRATVIDQLVDRIARTWERRTARAGQLSGGLTSNETTEALVSAFARISWIVGTTANGASVASVIEAVTATFVADWQLSGPRAETLAREALHFWDEAGILSITDDGTAVEPELRVLVEIGAARSLTAMDDAGPAVDVLLREETLHEIAVLAAGLSPDVARAVVDRAVALGEHSALMSAARGCADSAPAPELVEQLVPALLAAPGQGDDRVRTARIIASFAVPPRGQAAVLERFREILPAGDAAIVSVLAKARWQTSGSTDALEAVLRGGQPLRRTAGLRRPIAEVYDDLVVEGAQRLDLTRPDIVNMLENIAAHAHIGLLSRLAEATGARGLHLRLPGRSARVDLVETATRARQQMDRGFIEFLRLLMEPVPGRPLSWGERRRLDHLSTLFEILMVRESHPRDLDMTMDTARNDLRHLVAAAIAASGLEPERVSAEAAAAPAEIECGVSIRDVALLLMDSTGAHRDIAVDSGDVALLIGLLDSTQWITHVAANLLVHVAVDRRVEVAGIVATTTQSLHRSHRWLAGDLAAGLDPTNSTVTSWVRNNDPLLRSAAAAAAAKRHDPDVLRELLADRDGTVRYGGLVHIDPEKLNTDDDLHSLVKAIGSQGFLQQTCRSCGTPNPPDGEGYCTECGLEVPDPRHAAETLLAGRSPSW